MSALQRLPSTNVRATGRAHFGSTHNYDLNNNLANV